MDKFVDAQPEGADLSCARLQGASVTRAQLQGPHLIGAKLQGAHIDQAQSQGAHLWARGLKARRSLASAFGARGGGERVINLTDFHGHHARAFPRSPSGRNSLLKEIQEGERREVEARC
jgi:hypothetical protein